MAKEVSSRFPGRLQRGFGRYGASILRTYGIVLTLAILVGLVASQSPTFLSQINLLNLTSQYAAAGIMAVAMTYAIIAGGFDLSVAASFSLAAVTAAGLGRDHAPVIAFVAALGVGLAIGLINGWMITVIDINPFIATLGMSLILNGVALVVTGNKPFVVDRADFGGLGGGEWHTIPYAGMILFAVFIAGALVLHRTAYGQFVFAVGGNYEASRLSGIRVRTVVGSTYVLTGLSAGVAGAITASQLGSAQSGIDSGILFDVITVVIIGGTSLGGGFGAMWRTAVGLAIIATIANGFNLLDINQFYQDIIKGGIIIGALALDSYARNLARRSARALLGAKRA